jgi:general stress protein YciG
MTQIISPRGFATMDPQRQRQLAKMGGQKAHQNGSAHTFSTQEARNAGRKGGQKVSRDREYMAMIGKKGGKISGKRRQENQKPIESIQEQSPMGLAAQSGDS